MNTHFLSLGISAILVAGLVVSLAALSLLVGAAEWFFGRPRLILLKSAHGENGFAFAFTWNASKEETKLDVVKIRLFNPFGNPTQFEVTKSFDAKDSSFALDLDMGLAMRKILDAKGVKNGLIQVEVSSSFDGVSYQYDMKVQNFFKKMAEAEKTVADFEQKAAPAADVMEFGLRPKSFIADTVPGKGPQIKMATNPAFVQDFQAAPAAGAAVGAGAAAAAANFAITKVWIAPGCIVCNACENIFPEVFHVTADTCIIRPNAPLDNGLRVQEAAEACPVEVIKFTKA